MRTRSPAQRSVYAGVQHNGGAKRTKMATRRTCFDLIAFCTSIGMPIEHMKLVTFEQVQAFIDFKRSPPPSSIKKPSTAASLHNTVSQIRACMIALHGKPDQKRITAKNLGLPARSRKGTKEPVTDEVFFKAVALARAMGEIGFSIAIKIERYFGHRCLEALMSGSEINAYILQFQNWIRISQTDVHAPGGWVFPELSVSDGTKSARPRTTASIAKYAKESLETLIEAVTYLQTHKFLVEGKKEGLVKSISRTLFLARKCGLVGKYSMHSLRYRYACDKLVEYRDAGLDRRDAFMLVTEHLGHGKSRANAMIAGVYCQTPAKTFARMPRKRNLSQQVDSLNTLLETLYGNNKPVEPASSSSPSAPEQALPDSTPESGSDSN